MPHIPSSDPLTLSMLSMWSWTVHPFIIGYVHVFTFSCFHIFMPHTTPSSDILTLSMLSWIVSSGNSPATRTTKKKTVRRRKECKFMQGKFFSFGKNTHFIMCMCMRSTFIVYLSIISAAVLFIRKCGNVDICFFVWYTHIHTYTPSFLRFTFFHAGLLWTWHGHAARTLQSPLLV